MLFVGTNIGSVRVFLWPIKISETVPDYAEFFIHSERIVSLEMTHDAKCLVSSSDDGTIFFNKIKEYFNGIEFHANSTNIQNADPIKKKQYYQAQKCKVHLNMNDLSLVFWVNQDKSGTGSSSEQKLSLKTQQIQELKYKEENLKAYYQEERNSTANRFAEEINALNIKNAQDLENEKFKFKKLQEEHENERILLLKVNHTIIPYYNFR